MSNTQNTAPKGTAQPSGRTAGTGSGPPKNPAASSSTTPPIEQGFYHHDDHVQFGKYYLPDEVRIPKWILDRENPSGNKARMYGFGDALNPFWMYLRDCVRWGDKNSGAIHDCLRVMKPESDDERVAFERSLEKFLDEWKALAPLPEKRQASSGAQVL